MFDGSQVNLLVAFLAGILTFFASCLLPLVPIYLAYLSGISSSPHTKLDGQKQRKIFFHSFLFVIGFISVFMLLGATASVLGNFTAVYRSEIQRAGGVFFLLIGAFLLGWIKPQWLYHEFKFNPANLKLKHFHWLQSIIAGAAFGFAWTPCIGPVLAVILFWASQLETAWYGMWLLFVYGLGIGIPFLIVGWFFHILSPKIRLAEKYSHWFYYITGIVILITGFLMAINRLQYVTFWFMDSLNLHTFAI